MLGKASPFRPIHGRARVPTLFFERPATNKRRVATPSSAEASDASRNPGRSMLDCVARLR